MFIQSELLSSHRFGGMSSEGKLYRKTERTIDLYLYHALLIAEYLTSAG